jgi:UDP-N-acetylmuramoyl-L-alanyl-D-glutamate--2,6-diaminopimelate ligase
MKLSELLNKCPVLDVTGDLSTNITSIAYDSRTCAENSLFVAVPGLKADGHDYIEQAVCNSAVAVVYEKDISLPAGAAAIKV